MEGGRALSCSVPASVRWNGRQGHHQSYTQPVLRVSHTVRREKKGYDGTCKQETQIYSNYRHDLEIPRDRFCVHGEDIGVRNRRTIAHQVAPASGNQLLTALIGKWAITHR